MKPLSLALTLLLLLALLIGGASASPAGAYYVVYMSQHHGGSHYEPSGYTAPKAVSDNIVVFVLASLAVGPLSLMGIVFTQGFPALQVIIAIVALLVIVGYIFPTYTLMTNAMTNQMCVPNTAFNASCGDKQ
jgi:hypothetical protein